MNTPIESAEGSSAIDDVLKERLYQEEMWGGAEHDDKHSDIEWMKIHNHQHYQLTHGFDRGHETVMRHQLVQLCAVGIAWIEALDRRVIARETELQAKNEGELDAYGLFEILQSRWKLHQANKTNAEHRIAEASIGRAPIGKARDHLDEARSKLEEIEQIERILNDQLANRGETRND